MSSGSGAVADSTQIIVDEETTYGEVDSPAPTMQGVNFVNESLAPTSENTESATIRADRQTAGLIETSFGAGGDIATEMQFGGHDFWREGALGSAAAVAGTTYTAATISFESIATSPTTNPRLLDSANGFTFTVGEFVSIKAAATAGNVVRARVLTAAIGILELQIFSAAGDFTDEAAGASVTVAEGDQAENGTTCRSWTIERQHTDIGTFHAFLGMVVASLQFQATPGSVVSETFSFTGRSQLAGQVATVGDGAPTPAVGTDFLNSIDNIDGVLQLFGAASALVQVTEVSFTTQANLRARNVLGVKGAVSIGLGKFQVTGSIRAFMADKVREEQFLEFEDSSLTLILTDAAGNSYVRDFPRIKYTSYRANASGINTDVTVEADWTAYRENVAGGITSRFASIAA